MIEKILKNSLEAKEYLDENKSYFLGLLVDAIEDSYRYDLETISVGKIELIEEELTMEITVDKKNWEVTLDLAMDYYTETEEYEECIRIDEIRDKIGL